MACASNAGCVISFISNCGFSMPNRLPSVSVRVRMLAPDFPMASPGRVTWTTILVTRGVFKTSALVKPALSSSFFRYCSSSMRLMPCSTKILSIIALPSQPLQCGPTSLPHFSRNLSLGLVAHAPEPNGGKRVPNYQVVRVQALHVRVGLHRVQQLQEHFHGLVRVPAGLAKALRPPLPVRQDRK